MALLLTTPKQTGDLDPSAPNSQYAEAKIVHMSHWSNRKCIELVIEFGNTIDGEWTQGIAAPLFVTIEDRTESPNYTNLIAQTSEAAGENYYEKVAEKLYAWLISNGYLAGTYQ